MGYNFGLIMAYFYSIRRELKALLAGKRPMIFMQPTFYVHSL